MKKGKKFRLATLGCRTNQYETQAFRDQLLAIGFKEAVGAEEAEHSLHLVLQSDSNVVLKRMNRKYTRQIFLESVEKLKRVNPDFTLTLEVMRDVPFAKVHMFPYSPRDYS